MRKLGIPTSLASESTIHCKYIYSLTKFVFLTVLLLYLWQSTTVLNILKVCLHLIPSPSVKIQLWVGKLACWVKARHWWVSSINFWKKKFFDLTQQCFVLLPQVIFLANNLNIHWRWWNWIQAIFWTLLFCSIKWFTCNVRTAQITVFHWVPIFQLYNIFAVYFLRQLTRTLTAVLFYGELTIRQSQYFSRLPEVVVFTQWSIQKTLSILFL